MSGANTHRGYVPIEIGGEEYQLRLNFNAIARADQALGQSAIQALGTGRFDAIQTVIAVGLSNPRNGRNASKAARKLDGSKLEYYVDKISDALEASGVIQPVTDDSDVEDGDEGGDDLGEESGPIGGLGLTTTNNLDD